MLILIFSNFLDILFNEKGSGYTNMNCFAFSSLILFKCFSNNFNFNSFNFYSWLVYYSNYSIISGV